jgi:uncharacterized protein (DUF1330 family)
MQQRESAMTRYISMGLTLLTGIAIGAGAVGGLRAQAKPSTYAVVAIRKINDAEGFKEVIAKAPGAMQGSGGHYVVRTDKITPLDGTPPARFILIAFDSPEQAMAWHNSAAQKEVDALRMKTTDALSFIVDGM